MPTPALRELSYVSLLIRIGEAGGALGDAADAIRAVRLRATAVNAPFAYPEVRNAQTCTTCQAATRKFKHPAKPEEA